MATETKRAEETDLSANRLLAALPKKTRDELRPNFELVERELKAMLLSQGQPIEYVYFPVDAVGSLVSELDVGRSIEVATIGHEGMIGLPVFLNAAATGAYMGFVQIPGRLWQMRVDAFREHVANGSALHDVLQRYTQALFGQLAVNVACNRAHVVEERMARWLLMTQDRVGQDDFPLTQEFLAQMLGVRRGAVNEVATTLQDRGVISYSRGRITIGNRETLEELSCECYQRLNEEFDRLFPP